MTLRRAIWTCLAAASIFLLGCAGPSATEYYRNEELRQYQGSVQYQLNYNQGAEQFEFNEGVVDVRVKVYYDQQYHFGITLTNRTDHPIIVDWGGITYQDVDGNTWSMIHDGVKYLDPVAKEKPTSLPSAMSKDDLLRPAARVEQDGALRWVRPDSTPPAQDQWDTVSIMLPMKVEGQWRRYHLNLQVGQAAPSVWDD